MDPATSAAWAAWAQAIGSVGALGLTLWLWRKSARQERDRTLGAARAFALNLVTALDRLIAICDGQDTAAVEGQIATLKEVMRLGQMLQVSELEEAQMQSAILALGTGARAIQHADAHLRSYEIATHWGHHTATYKKALDEAKGAARALGVGVA